MTGPEHSPEKKVEQFGRNVTMEVDFMRHEQPLKKPDGTSADSITEAGKQAAAEKGKEIKQTVKGYASPKLRAQETVDLMLQNVGDEARILSQRINEIAAGTLKGQKPENVFNIRLRRQLDAIAFGPIMPEASKWADEQLAAGSKQNKDQLIVGYYLEHPGRARELGMPTPEEVAQELAFVAGRELGMAPRLRNNSNVRLVNVSHGPKGDAFFCEIAIKDGKRGPSLLQEAGGAFNPGENLRIISKSGDAAGPSSMTLRFRDQSYEIDAARLQQLGNEYAERVREPN